MTQSEKITVRDLIDRMEKLEENGNDRNEQLTRVQFDLSEVNHKIDKILSILQDDPNSNTKGLISKVNHHDREISKAKTRVTAIASVISFFGVFATFLINTYSKLN